jgi:hypothetical protein
MLSAKIYIKSMAENFAPINTVWVEWALEGHGRDQLLCIISYTLFHEQKLGLHQPKTGKRQDTAILI